MSHIAQYDTYNQLFGRQKLLHFEIAGSCIHRKLQVAGGVGFVQRLKLDGIGLELVDQRTEREAFCGKCCDVIKLERARQHTRQGGRLLPTREEHGWAWLSTDPTTMREPWHRFNQTPVG